MKVIAARLTPTSLFEEKHSLLIRIWHWCTFLVISASLVTVLFASTIFATRSNIAMVQEQVKLKDGLISTIQARAVAHEYSDKLWMLHKYIGYGLCFLLLSRVLIEAVQSKEEKIAVKIKKALKLSIINVAENERKHYLFVKGGYILFYITFAIMAVTGFGLAYEDVPFLKAIHKPLIQIHSVVQYIIYFYILAHLIGVIRSEVTNNKGIVSGMINSGT